MTLDHVVLAVNKNKMAKWLCLCVALCVTVFSVSSSMVGSFTEQDVNNDDYKGITNFAVQDLEGRSNSMYKIRLVQLKKIETQVSFQN